MENLLKVLANNVDGTVYRDDNVQIRIATREKALALLKYTADDTNLDDRTRVVGFGEINDVRNGHSIVAMFTFNGGEFSSDEPTYKRFVAKLSSMKVIEFSWSPQIKSRTLLIIADG